MKDASKFSCFLVNLLVPCCWEVFVVMCDSCWFPFFKGFYVVSSLLFYQRLISLNFLDWFCFYFTQTIHMPITKGREYPLCTPYENPLTSHKGPQSHLRIVAMDVVTWRVPYKMLLEILDPHKIFQLLLRTTVVKKQYTTISETHENKYVNIDANVHRVLDLNIDWECTKWICY